MVKQHMLYALPVVYMATGFANAQTTNVLQPTLDRDGRAVYELEVKYIASQLYDPMTGRDDKVYLRNYIGRGATTALVAPQIEATPGQTLRVNLINKLPTEDSSCTETTRAEINEPHCFNTTNLHMHGFWVSPTGNSDNVLLSIPPGASFEYEYAIPADHPSGTYFYHTHQHGSTALQVSSGMAGAVIVRGNRLPARRADGSIRHGDIDTILKSPDGTAFNERVMLLQQIPYACRDKTKKVKAAADERWLCAPGDVGEVEAYDLFGQSTWDRSGRFTGINGKIVPTFNAARAGHVERWRVIHAGVRDSVTVELRKLDPKISSARYKASTPQERRRFVDENCTGPMVPMFGIALDGLTRKKVTVQNHAAFQPAYRQDLLVTFPEPGRYCIIDDENASVEATGSKLNDRELLGYVDVEPGQGPIDQSPQQIITTALMTAARTFVPADVKDSVLNDLGNGLGLTAFIDHDDVTSAELTGTQTLGLWYFNKKIGEKEADYQHEIGELGRSIDGKLVLKNPAPFDPKRIDRTLPLGGADEWTLSSFWGGHPFHIHVNPFQVVSIIDPTGRDVSGPGEGQFANLKGEWKDTLFIEQGYVVTFRTRYERYIGDFVLHCHILDHEDKGMMQNVRIAPALNGKLVNSAHHPG